MTTANPVLEPPIIIVRTVLSLIAVDYPANKLACYVSDDGCSPLTFYTLVEASKLAKLRIPFLLKLMIIHGSCNNNRNMKEKYKGLGQNIEDATKKFASFGFDLCGEVAVFSNTECRNHPAIVNVIKEAHELPPIDMLVTTADPVLKPPIITVNTVLSLIVVDYPTNKLVCYVSDNGCSPLTFYVLVEASKFAKLRIPFYIFAVGSETLSTTVEWAMTEMLKNLRVMKEAQAEDIFIAGSETLSTTVEWAKSEMLKNRRVIKEAKAEVRHVFDRKGKVDETGINELKFLKAVIKETLRLHPTAPLLVPRENSDSCQINGYEIPAKTRTVVNAWAIARDPKYWTEAEKFNLSDELAVFSDTECQNYLAIVKHHDGEKVENVNTFYKKKNMQ
ncbi:hypothetical protein Q3G72_033220 [Acer saccharum]|nr:hypothetical protein Q3G72_033220 [Acer saccharum]